MFKKLYYKIFKHYRRLELKFVSYLEANQLLKDSALKPESEKWVIAKEEDGNMIIGFVYLERKERITN